MTFEGKIGGGGWEMALAFGSAFGKCERFLHQLPELYYVDQERAGAGRTDGVAISRGEG